MERNNDCRIPSPLNVLLEKILPQSGSPVFCYPEVKRVLPQSRSQISELTRNTCFAEPRESRGGAHKGWEDRREIK